jgi:hypothetical protein
MQEVMNGRQEQVKYHLEQNRIQQEQIQIEQKRLEADFLRKQQQEELRREKHQNEAKKYSNDLMDQIQKARQLKIEEKKRSEAEDEAHRVSFLDF